MGWLVGGLMLATVIVGRSNRLGAPMALAFIAGLSAAFWVASWWWGAPTAPPIEPPTAAG